jgi:hypothetical protein
MRSSRTPKLALTAACVAQLGLAAPTFAQTWLPARREGNVTLAYQNLLARGHLLPTGGLAAGPPGADTVRSHALTAELEYGLTDRIALKLSLPYVTAKYVGAVPHRLGVHNDPSVIDDGTYHGTSQDVRLGVRWNVLSRRLAITPFAEGIIPSHHYESRGHAVVGQDLRALVAGVNLGVLLDALPGTYFQAQLSHGFVQKVAGMRPNRSHVNAEAGYFVTQRLAIRVVESWQTTHEGLDFPYAGLPSALSQNHDRLSRNNYLTLGGGLVFAIDESWQLFGSVGTMVWGQNVHRRRGFSIGVNRHFGSRRPSAAAGSNPHEPM